MATANIWILTGPLRPADVGSHRARKPRLFSVVTIFEVKVTGDLGSGWVRRHRSPLAWRGKPQTATIGMGPFRET